MTTPRAIFVGIVAVISIIVIIISIDSRGYEEVGRVNEYVLYYDTESESTELYEQYILKNGLYEVSVKEAIENEEISDEYIVLIDALIAEWESLREESN